MSKNRFKNKKSFKKKPKKHIMNNMSKNIKTKKTSKYINLKNINTL